MKYESETGAGKAIETVKHLNGLEKVCKNNTNSIADIDDNIVVKMPHIVSFNDSLIVIQMFQSIKSTACNGGKITFGEGTEAYVDAIYTILSEYARALAIAENNGGSEVVPEEIKEPDIDKGYLENGKADKEIYKAFGKDIIDKAASMNDLAMEFSRCLGMKGSCNIMNDISRNSAISLINIDKEEMAKYINESENIVGYLVAVLDKKAYDERIVFAGNSFTYWVGDDYSDEIGCVYLDEHPKRENTDGRIDLVFNFDIVKSGCNEQYFQHAKDFYFILCNAEKCGELSLTLDNTILRVMKLDKDSISYSCNGCTITYNIDPVKYQHANYI